MSEDEDETTLSAIRIQTYYLVKSSAKRSTEQLGFASFLKRPSTRKACGLCVRRETSFVLNGIKSSKIETAISQMILEYHSNHIQ